jgi:hypothetical protein
LNERLATIYEICIAILGLFISLIGMVISDTFIASEIAGLSCPAIVDMATANYIISLMGILLRIKQLCALLEVGGAIITGLGFTSFLHSLA